jgi:hypothetical protein
MSTFNDAKAVEAAVRSAVAETPITDIHTHLFPPAHGNLLDWGPDQLLTYHYLVAELFTLAPRSLTPEKFWKLPKPKQADLVWKHVFLKHGPISEATRGVLTTFTRLGLDVSARDLTPIRQWYAQQTAEGQLARVMEVAGLDGAVMTNNPFVAEEVECWDQNLKVPKSLKTALRIDAMIRDWPTAARIMADAGYAVSDRPTGASAEAAKKFLIDWAKRLKPLYMAASLTDEYAYPSKGTDTAAMQNIVLPVARELNLPMALMIGVRYQVNPALRLGGDVVGVADVKSVATLCAENPDVKFMVTMLSRVNQHELAVTARKFGNLHLFGCWWFCNNPSIIEEMTRQRLELLGTAFTCQHSDARVLDQLVYKWAHTRTIVADVLAEKFRDQFLAGWRPTEEDIRRDVRALFGGSFKEFLAK